MDILASIKQSIVRTGIKEVARRSGLATSTVSRVSSGRIQPSLEAIEKISEALGLHLELHPNPKDIKGSRLSLVKVILLRLRKELKTLGLKHVTVFGSVARQEDKPQSDIDLFLDFGHSKPSIAQLLKVEGKILEAFDPDKVDMVSNLSSPKGQRLKEKIDKDGVIVF